MVRVNVRYQPYTCLLSACSVCTNIVIISCFYKLSCLAGECSDVPPGGKLSCYLLQHNPLLWQQLIKRNVIRRYLHEAALVLIHGHTNVIYVGRPEDLPNRIDR